MKRTYLLVLLAVISFFTVEAQDIQLHYDLGKTRKLATATVELFKPDNYGSTFFFVDMDFGGKAKYGRTPEMNLAYFEIARGFKFWKAPIEMTVEYNGGLLRNDANGGYPLSTSYLTGPAYTWNSKDWSKVFTFKVLYKREVNVNKLNNFNKNNIQLTGVWNLNFFNNKFTCSGFADFWTEKIPVMSKGQMETSNYVFLTEPQFWYNYTKNVAFGGEVEISSNFALNKGGMVNPTLAIKYTF